ncbi:hypothetical protein [Streptomyces sp. JJ36]|uniref:hypothetical protein n=1 Tax=Streptomyces sp. JJ36 TaxID=2736645 RepID=UPI001F424EE2|nr:hypothetical protein [Streptomyces sp. JJ36]MCF6525556.1 hypothetical protein [Streptomyces sp. JJ36]
MRDARLPAASFAGALCLLGAAAPAAFAEPTAEVAPRRVTPGATVTVSVSCDPLPGRKRPPRSIKAYSQVFRHGEATLQLTPTKDDTGAGPAYTGTARIVSARHLAGGGPDTVGRKSTWGIDGACPDGADWETGVTVDRRPGGGAHAGEGGSLGGGNATAVAAGGVLLAGALSWGVYVLRREV